MGATEASLQDWHRGQPRPDEAAVPRVEDEALPQQAQAGHRGPPDPVRVELPGPTVG